MRRSILTTTIAAVPMAAALTMPASAAVDKQTFAEIKMGMTYDQVRALFGADGDQTSQSEIAGQKSAVYVWHVWHPDGNPVASVVCVFANGHLISKTQIGLK
jgi:hypothetical protein